MSKKSRVVALLLMLVMVLTLIPINSFAASKNIKTYAFFGSDSRATGDAWKTDKSTGTEGSPRSDVIMLLTVNKKKKTITVTSIYRDTMLDVSGKGKEFGKANKAYSNGGAKLAVKCLQKNLGIKIDGYAVANFQRVADAIDDLGGVTIKVENTTIDKAYQKKGLKKVPDVANSLIDELNRVYDLDTKHIKAGKQKLSGIQAVAYARVRYTTGYAKQRTVRERMVLKEMFKKFKKAKAAKKVSVINNIHNSVQTNMSLSSFTSLLKSVAKYKMVVGKGFPYYKKDVLVKTKLERLGESWVVVPCDLNTNVKKLHKVLYGQKKYKLTSVTKKYSKKIQKATKATYKNRNKKMDNKY